MFGEEDSYYSSQHIDESQWINVQDPIRNIILGIIKSVRSQANSLRDVDRRIGEYLRKNELEKIVHEESLKFPSKIEFASLSGKVQTKATQIQYDELGSKIEQVIIHYLQWYTYIIQYYHNNSYHSPSPLLYSFSRIFLLRYCMLSCQINLIA